MMNIISKLVVICLCMPVAAALAAGQPQKVKADLISAVTAVVPGQTFEVAVRERIASGWHTYWKNPGDAGLPTRIDWHLPEGFNAGPIQWPWPSRVPYGPLIDYGYRHEVVLPVKITAPANLSGDHAVLRAQVKWLVCANICVPGHADLALTLPVAARAATNAQTAAIFANAHRHIPRKLDIDSTWRLAGKQIRLHIPMKGLTGAYLKSVDFFPDSGGVIDNAARQHYRAGADGLTLTLAGGDHVTPGSSLAGVVVVTETRGQTQTSGFVVEPTFVAGAGKAGGATLGPGTAILFALLGGLILNLMPCVFPVLSMKVVALAEHRGRGEHVRLNGWVYAAGVVLSFLAIASLLISLRAGGQQIGWGFQLQSPIVVTGLVYLFFMIGLNLSGYFEAGASLMGIGDGLASRPGVTGSFFTGVLATVVAAPCTAPFMAGAVGYALLVNNLLALSIFAALGVGMAAPYVLLCYFPASVRLLPRPGAWMRTFKEFLAFPMYGSAVWLIWVLSEETGSSGVLYVLTGVLLLALGVWLWRYSRRRPAVMVLALVPVLAALYLPFGLAGEQHQTGVAADAGGPPPGYKGPVWQPYSASRLAAARKQGPVFVDFTAAWCITCKVNEAVALDSAKVKAAFAAKGVRYLRGDWTNQDPAITAALAKYGRSGVPLYLLYRPGRQRAEVLPQILTESTVLRTIESL